MPLYMDLHKNLQGLSPEALALAHLKDLEVQWKHGVKYLRYWFNEQNSSVFCLVDAPNIEAAQEVHRSSHGLVADEIIEVGATEISDLLGVPVNDEQATDPSDDGFRTILFTDMERSTEMTQRLGDERAMKVLREHNAIIRQALHVHQGREVKHTGDGIMASFRSPSRAVEYAISVQRAFAGHDWRDDERIHVRIGCSAGEPVADNKDLFGAVVQLAARACAHAEPEQILAASVIRDLCLGKQFSFADRGVVPLRGFDEPVRLYEVRWRE